MDVRTWADIRARQGLRAAMAQHLTYKGFLYFMKQEFELLYCVIDYETEEAIRRIRASFECITGEGI